VTVPAGFRDEAEWQAWQNEWHEVNRQLEDLASRANVAHANALADLAGRSGILSGVPLPEEVRSALATARRIEGFLPFLDVADVPRWATELARLLSLVARALGVR